VSLQILIWRKSTMNEVYPWSPAMKQYHRANMHLFQLTGYEINIARDFFYRSHCFIWHFFACIYVFLFVLIYLFTVC